MRAPRFFPRPILLAAAWAGLGPLIFFGRAAEWPGAGELAGGAGHALVVREEGQLWEFGTNQPTSLGSWTNEAQLSTNRFLPRRVGSQSGWRGVETMGDTNGTSFALREDGSLWGWGDNRSGQLGDGTGVSRRTPSPAGAGQVWKTVSSRSGSVFAVRQDGTLWAWGLNEPASGTLGIGRGRARVQLAPVQIGSASDWQSVQASRGSLTVSTSSVVTTITNTNTGVVTTVTNRLVQTFGSGQGGAGLRGSGEIWAWGTALVRTATITNTNSTNALIVALTTNFVPVRVGAAADWKQLAFAQASFALKQDGSLWRFNEASADFEPFPSATNANHAGWKVLRGFQTGEGTNATGHVVGLKTNGTLWAWGDNSTGQVDAQLSTEEAQEEPWPITGIDGVEDGDWSEVGAGPGHSLAMTKNGQVFSWGLSGYLPPALQRTPARVEAPGVSWGSALAGENFSLGLEKDGRIYAWGVTGITNAADAVVRLPELVSSGASPADPDWAETGWTNGLAVFGRVLGGIDGEGNLKTWGNPEGTVLFQPWWNPLRQAGGIRNFGPGWSRVTGSRGLALGTTNTNTTTPEQDFAAAIKTEGTLWTWGANEAGQLGDGTKLAKDSPVRVGSESTWAGVSVGAIHTLAWKRDGSLWGWGANSNGELGLNTNVVTVSNNFSGGTNSTNSTNSTNTTPRVYGGRTQTTTIALASNVVTPRLVLGKGWGVRDVSAGGSHTLVLRGDGSLWTMGANDSGQLGRGALTRGGQATNGGGTNTNPASTNITNRFQTVSVTSVVTNINFVPWRVETNVDTTVDQASGYRPQRLGNKLWKSVAAGEGHSLAVRSDGTLWAWGKNDSAQLGNGTLVSTNQPVQIGAANRWAAVFAGKEHSLALQKDGTLWAWGKNDGRLGIVTPEESQSPFREVVFGLSGQATLVLESAGRGTNRLLATGLASFSPRNTNFALALQVDAPGVLRSEWSGTGSYRASRHHLTFSSLTATPVGETGSTGTILPTANASSRLVLGEMKSSWWQPEIYRGTAVIDGTNCQAVLRFAGDADRDGIPDFADATPRGTAPVLPAKLQIRIQVGESVQYDLPGLSEGATPILSAELSDLPSGLQYAEGSITGAANPEAVGIHEVVVGAVNEAGETYRTLKIEVVPPNPVPGQSERIVWTNGSSPFSHTIRLAEAAYEGFPFVFRAQNVPPGLVLEKGNGILRPARRGFAGVPSPGFYRMVTTISHRAGGRASQVLELESLPGPDGRWQVGKPLRFQVRLGGKGQTEITGIPPGCRVNPGNGTIFGIPVEAGEFSVTARQRRGGDGLEAVFVLQVDPAAAAVSSQALSTASASGPGGAYPAIFSMGPLASQELQAKGRVQNLSPTTRRYSLVWIQVESWKWDAANAGLATRLQDAETILRKSERAMVRQTAPSALRLARISYASGQPGVLFPTNHAFWLRDAEGRAQALSDLPGEWAVDFSHPEFLRLLAERVKFLIQNGCVDGVYLPDWDEMALWPTDFVPKGAQPGTSQGPVRLALLQQLRKAVGEQGWIVAEATGGSWALTGPCLDGVHLVGATEPPPAWPPAEGWWPDPYMLEDKESHLTLWERLAQSLQMFGQPGVLRKPGQVMLELWARHDLKDPRTREPRLAGLAMSLCLSDGAYLYARPDWWQEKGKAVVPGEHLWFPEWGVRLGRPLGAFRNQAEEKGFFRRSFENGWAAYAPFGLRSAAKLEFAEEVESVATGKRGRTHELLPGHGDLFLKKN